MGPTWGAVVPMRKAATRTAASGSVEYTAQANPASMRPLAVPATRRTTRWPYRSAAAPSSGPTHAVPRPTIAELRPANESDPRAETTRVRTPTTIIANGRRATNATGK